MGCAAGLTVGSDPIPRTRDTQAGGLGVVSFCHPATQLSIEMKNSRHQVKLKLLASRPTASDEVAGFILAKSHHDSMEIRWPESYM
jgi:hypothetical protein